MSLGRVATRPEVLVSIGAGLPALEVMAQEDGAPAIDLLNKQVARFEKWLPVE